MQSIPNPDRRMQKLSSLDRIQSLVSGQMDVLDALKKGGAGAGETQALPGAGVSAEIARNEPLMNEAWTLLGNLRLGEQRLLSKRMEEVRLVRHRDYLLIFLSVLAGLGSRAIAMYFFHKRVVRRVRQLTENARSLRDGSLLVHEPSDHADEIGELERELARIGDYIAGRRIDP